eukprot:CAMPEP_0169284114 /NCGR_PEP_ID=MMETSP1016-20121227/57940_1 /TAXON_ID=342587 /ORGANISM="Karlodinium micrum, Strain CCMP2283" /LENGTH=1035 /DNA_ID=CAMNT_0009373429 /DNA_START=43 /DNA_END=3147 /DNA_ORIENTATION=+
MDSPSPTRYSSFEASNLDAREVTLLTQRLKTAESAIEEERSLNIRERAVLAERLAFVEAQDAATRERLAQALASLTSQNSELQETMVHAASEEADYEEQRLRSEDLFEHRLRAIDAEKYAISQEAQQAAAARESISLMLKQRDSDLDAEVAERNRLAVALRLQEHEVEEQRARCRDESARAGTEQRRLEMELQQLRQGKEAAVSRLGELETMLQAELQAGKATSARISQAEQERMHQNAEMSELASLRSSLEQECLEKERCIDRLHLEFQELRREGESRAAALHDEFFTLRSRSEAESAEFQRLSFDLERRLQLSVSHESSALGNLEARERERVAELRATLRSEMRLEVNEAEVAAILRVETAERIRQAELRSELLESAEGCWRLRSQHEEADVERSLVHEQKLLALENDARNCEDRLRTELQQTREAFRCLEAASDMRIAALQQSASHERAVSAEQSDQVRSSLQNEVRELRSRLDRESRDAAERIERAERRDRDTQYEVCTELHRLRDDILLRQVNTGDNIKVEVMHAQLQDLRSLCLRQEVAEKELRAELHKERTGVNGFQLLDDALPSSVSKMEELAKQREANLRAEFDRRECMLKAQFQGELYEEQRMLQARVHAEHSDIGVLQARFQAEVTEAKCKQLQEADAFANAKSRCRELERLLQSSTVENATLRHRIQQLEADNLALSQIGTSFGHGGEAMKEECRWRSFALENSVRAAEAEAQAARAELQQGNLELQRAVINARSEEKRACERARSEEKRASDRAKDEAREWLEAVKSARESERLAMEELKKSEDKRRGDLIRMDTLISDTHVLSQSLSEHQHLAKDLNQMIRRQEQSLSKPTSPISKPTSPARSSSSILTRDLHSLHYSDEVVPRNIATPTKVASSRGASPRGTTPDTVKSWAEISTTINRDIAHLSRRAGSTPSTAARNGNSLSWASPVHRASAPSLLMSERSTRSLSPAFSAWSPASSTFSATSPALGRIRAPASKDMKGTHSSREPVGFTTRHAYLSPGSQPHRSSTGGIRGRHRPGDV